MTVKRRQARAVAESWGSGRYWIHLAEIVESDFEWLASAEELTLWNVRVPPQFFSRLEKLWWLDIRGGSGTDLDCLRGCKRLKYFCANQIRGLYDLSAISGLLTLRYLDLYGLPQVTQLPSCAALAHLAHATLGQLRGLQSLGAVLEAPNLQEIQLIRKININKRDIHGIVSHTSIKRFSWFAEDVPGKVWMPVVQTIGLPKVPVHYPRDWFVERNETGES